MAKKKKERQSDSPSEDGTATAPKPAPARASSSKKQAPPPSSLIICRNKHWKYISSFHGPWLQLPPETLELLAVQNYTLPQPRQIDPSVFFDLVKIRRAVEESVDLAVRATSGTTSSSLRDSINGGNGILGVAASLGFGYGGGTATLSRDRKFKMRESASKKLSKAYHLDEIAASVATMQSASSLEDVASHVLQRNPADRDAKYVHFFHEKIPSRMLAECTPLDPLNEVIIAQPDDVSPWRTRGVTRVFKEDYAGAVQDLTQGLAWTRYWQAQHKPGNGELILASALREEERNGYNRDWRDQPKIAEEDQPSSMELQLLFHRAGVYLTIACQAVDAALDGLVEAQNARAQAMAETNGDADGEAPPLSATEREAHRARLDARKVVKTNAKRALKDYTSFLSHLDYTPGYPAEIVNEFQRRVNNAANGLNRYHSHKHKRLLEMSGNLNLSNGALSDALIPHKNVPPPPENPPYSKTVNGWPSLPPPEIYQASALFSATPPPNLPDYPNHTTSITKNGHSAIAHTIVVTECQEAITYHPLLTDALHSLLLCHALLQTSPKELLRHAHNTARLARICDGYPIFLAARSPARADWIEVLRCANNWISLAQSWEALCAPAPLPSQTGANGHAAGGVPEKKETPEQKHERVKQEAIIGALADERVVDEESFQAAVRARERRALEDEEGISGPFGDASPTPPSPPAPPPHATASTTTDAHPSSSSSASPPSSNTTNGHTTAAAAPNGTTSPPPSQPPAKRWAQDDGKEYPISTKRAEAIARWVREAPLSVGGAKKKGKGKGKGRARAGGKKTFVAARGVDVGRGQEEDEEEDEVD
ncbi:hypothetical protein B0A49_11013 [Cryomyces minteri]|uniref:Uncharacterized protein n=1 Tax=Cryomyces minteri TaxID=331657 RepID=A0A4U0WDY8_9PEZI|nr:hypothetical protein B0A49_11013 [Cryomyces minteri]